MWHEELYPKNGNRQGENFPKKRSHVIDHISVFVVLCLQENLAYWIIKSSEMIEIDSTASRTYGEFKVNIH